MNCAPESLARGKRVFEHVSQAKRRRDRKVGSGRGYICSRNNGKGRRIGELLVDSSRNVVQEPEEVAREGGPAKEAGQPHIISLGTLSTILTGCAIHPIALMNTRPLSGSVCAQRKGQRTFLFTLCGGDAVGSRRLSRHERSTDHPEGRDREGSSFLFEGRPQLDEPPHGRWGQENHQILWR